MFDPTIERTTWPIDKTFNFFQTTIEKVDFRNLDLRDVACYKTTFVDCDFEGTDFSFARFDIVKFINCNFRNVKFEHSEIYGDSNSEDQFSGSILPDFQIPQEEELTVYKKLRGKPNSIGSLSWEGIEEQYLCVLRIPAGIKRTASLIGNKCRAEKAIVVSIDRIVDTGDSYKLVPATIAYSYHNCRFEYRVGEEVVPEEFDGDIRAVCLPGIHFFRTKEEALDYNY